MANEMTLPFGRHQGRPLPFVPTPYLGWLLRETKLSAALATAVADELTRRGERPPTPRPRMTPTCPKCGVSAGVRYEWKVDSLQRRMIARVCCGCNRFLSYATQSGQALAEANRAGVLTACGQAGEL
jgi:hypothetical protein